MKKLYKAVLGGLVSLPLLFGGCREYNAELQGTVVNEKYVPAVVGGCSNHRSEYIIVLETEEHGKKAVKIWGKDIESIEALIEKGSKVTIKVTEDELTQSKIKVRDYRVKRID